MRRPLVMVALLAATSSLEAPSTPPLPPRAEVIRVADSLVGAYMAKNSAPGIAVAIVRGTDTVVMRGWGKAKLDDPIGSDRPTLPVAWHPVTVRQLLTHTSGIRSDTGVGPTWVARWGEEMSPDTIVALVANNTFGADVDPDMRIVFTMTGNNATKLTLKQGGGTMEAPRK